MGLMVFPDRAGMAWVTRVGTCANVVMGLPAKAAESAGRYWAVGPPRLHYAPKDVR